LTHSMVSSRGNVMSSVCVCACVFVCVCARVRVCSCACARVYVCKMHCDQTHTHKCARGKTRKTTTKTKDRTGQAEDETTNPRKPTKTTVQTPINGVRTAQTESRAQGKQRKKKEKPFDNTGPRDSHTRCSPRASQWGGGEDEATCKGGFRGVGGRQKKEGVFFFLETDLICSNLIRYQTHR